MTLVRKHILVVISFLAAISVTSGTSEEPFYPYCPNAIQISPCTCIHGTEGIDVFPTITCENLYSEEQLRTVFSKTFPTYILRKIIIQDSTLETLPAFVFSEKVSYELFINNTNVVTIDEDAISRMNDTLQAITATYNPDLKDFPFNALASFGDLRDLKLDHNDLSSLQSLPNLPSLKTLSISDNRNLKNLTALPLLPALLEFNASNCGISSIEPETFLGGTMIKLLNMSNNPLKILRVNSSEFSSSNLETLDFSFCEISEIEEGALNMSSANVKILLRYNQLTDIPEQVFQPLVDNFVAYNGTGNVDLTGNPIVCCCDLDWLVSNQTYTGYFHEARCAGGALVAEIAPDYFVPICPAKVEETTDEP